MWSEIHKSYKFVQSFQVGEVKHAQSDWKQWVSCILKMTLHIHSIFCMWLGIDEYMYVIHDSIQMAMVKRTLACQK